MKQRFQHILNLVFATCVFAPGLVLYVTSTAAAGTMLTQDMEHHPGSARAVCASVCVSFPLNPETPRPDHEHQEGDDWQAKAYGYPVASAVPVVKKTQPSQQYAVPPPGKVPRYILFSQWRP